MHFQLFHFAGGTIEVVNEDNFNSRHGVSLRLFPTILAQNTQFGRIIEDFLPVSGGDKRMKQRENQASNAGLKEDYSRKL